jgi:hypothetical protein
MKSGMTLAATQSAHSLCRACGGRAEALFNGQVLGRIAVSYHRCTACMTLQLPSPHWLDEAYRHTPHPDPDSGRLMRAQIVHRVIRRLRAQRLLASPLRVLDEGAGLGLLVRLLRDEGIEAWGHDRYAPAVVAEEFIVTQWPEGHFGLICATEVIEHTEDPCEFVRGLAGRLNEAGVLLLTTELYHGQQVPEVGRWPYLAAQYGQHITFLSAAGLRAVATQAGLVWWTSLEFAGSHCIHLLGSRTPSRWTLRRLAWRHARGEARWRDDGNI